MIDTIHFQIANYTYCVTGAPNIEHAFQAAVRYSRQQRNGKPSDQDVLSAYNSNNVGSSKYAHSKLNDFIKYGQRKLEQCEAVPSGLLVQRRKDAVLKAPIKQIEHQVTAEALTEVQQHNNQYALLLGASSQSQNTYEAISQTVGFEPIQQAEMHHDANNTSHARRKRVRLSSGHAMPRLPTVQEYQEQAQKSTNLRFVPDVKHPNAVPFLFEIIIKLLEYESMRGNLNRESGAFSDLHLVIGEDDVGVSGTKSDTKVTVFFVDKSRKILKSGCSIAMPWFTCANSDFASLAPLRTEALKDLLLDEQGRWVEKFQLDENTNGPKFSINDTILISADNLALWEECGIVGGKFRCCLCKIESSEFLSKLEGNKRIFAEIADSVRMVEEAFAEKKARMTSDRAEREQQVLNDVANEIAAGQRSLPLYTSMYDIHERVKVKILTPTMHIFMHLYSSALMVILSTPLVDDDKVDREKREQLLDAVLTELRRTIKPVSRTKILNGKAHLNLNGVQSRYLSAKLIHMLRDLGTSPPNVLVQLIRACEEISYQYNADDADTVTEKFVLRLMGNTFTVVSLLEYHQKGLANNLYAHEAGAHVPEQVDELGILLGRSNEQPVEAAHQPHITFSRTRAKHDDHMHARAVLHELLQPLIRQSIKVASRKTSYTLNVDAHIKDILANIIICPCIYNINGNIRCLFEGYLEKISTKPYRSRMFLNLLTKRVCFYLDCDDSDIVCLCNRFEKAKIEDLETYDLFEWDREGGWQLQLEPKGPDTDSLSVRKQRRSTSQASSQQKSTSSIPEEDADIVLDDYNSEEDEGSAAQAAQPARRGADVSEVQQRVSRRLRGLPALSPDAETSQTEISTRPQTRYMDSRAVDRWKETRPSGLKKPPKTSRGRSRQRRGR